MERDGHPGVPRSGEYEADVARFLAHPPASPATRAVGALRSAPVLGAVVERASVPPTAPSLTLPSRPRTAPGAGADAPSDEARMRAEIDESSRAAIGRMTREEIAEEQAFLQRTLPAGLVEKWSRR